MIIIDSDIQYQVSTYIPKPLKIWCTFSLANCGSYRRYSYYS